MLGKIPTMQYGSGELMVRVHSVSMTAGTPASNLKGYLVLDGSTPEDPAHTFVDTSSAITGSTATVDDQTSAGDIVVGTVTGDLGYQVALIVSGTPGSAGGACAAEISVVLVLKDN